jgi:hypothetical protein
MIKRNKAVQVLANIEGDIEGAGRYSMIEIDSILDALESAGNEFAPEELDAVEAWNESVKNHDWVDIMRNKGNAMRDFFQAEIAREREAREKAELGRRG